MRPINYLPIAIAALAINSGGFASAEFSQALQHKVTVALTESYEDGNVFKETSNGYSDSQKIVQEKISNKEILEFFDEQGVIDEIKGWSIVVITYDGEIEGFYLVKKDGAEIDVSDYFYFDDDNDAVESYSETYAQDDTNETSRGTYAESSWGEFGIYYYNEEDQEIVDIYLDGIYTIAGEYEEIYNFDADEYTTDVENITSASIVNAVGHIENFDDFSSLVSGSAKVGSGKPIE